MDILKISALAYLIIYYGFLLCFRTYILYKKTGINAIRRMGRKGIEGFVERTLMFCFALVSVIVLNFVFLENNYQWLIPIEYLESTIIGYVGIGLCVIGLLLAIVAQLQMGNSWRLGLDRNVKTALVTKGLFKYSRNPIYFWLMISYLGFFLMMPNALSLLFLVLSYVGIEIKVRLEEQFLEERMPAYREYKNSVRRWFGRFPENIS